MNDSPAPDPKELVIGVDVGGSKIALMATDVATGEDLAWDRYATPADSGPSAMLAQIRDSIHKLVEEAGRKPSHISALGIAMPGLVDAEHGRVVVAGNLSGWQDVPLRDILHREFGVPVFVDNDANAAALGEKWRGAAKQMHNFVFLALGTGAGAGVVINGRIHRGYHHAAGEMGSLVLQRRFFRRRRNDAHGNLELLIGGPAIREEAREITGRKMKTAEALKRADRNEDLEVLAERTADYVAMTVIAISTVLDPEAVIFGGGTAAAGEALLDRVRERVVRTLNPRPALMLSALGEDAQLHGAVFGALWQLHPDLALREELR